MAPPPARPRRATAIRADRRSSSVVLHWTQPSPIPSGARGCSRTRSRHAPMLRSRRARQASGDASTSRPAVELAHLVREHGMKMPSRTALERARPPRLVIHGRCPQPQPGLADVSTSTADVAVDHSSCNGCSAPMRPLQLPVAQPLLGLLAGVSGELLQASVRTSAAFAFVFLRRGDELAQAVLRAEGAVFAFEGEAGGDFRVR